MTDSEYEILHDILMRFLKERRSKIVDNPFAFNVVLLFEPDFASKAIFDSQVRSLELLRVFSLESDEDGSPTLSAIDEFCTVVLEMADQVSIWDSKLAFIVSSSVACIALGVSVFSKEWAPIITIVLFMFPVLMYAQLRLRTYEKGLRDFVSILRRLKNISHV